MDEHTPGMTREMLAERDRRVDQAEAAAAALDDSRTASAPPEGGRWEFNAEVAAAFDDMLERSIPNYADMRRITTDAAAHVWDDSGGGLILDLGASRGAALQPLVDRIGVRAHYGAVEVSAPMREALQERFKDWESHVRIIDHDLRAGLPPSLPPVSVVLSVLTLQFVPIEYRQMLLRDIHRVLRPNGGLVLVEKVLGESDESNRLLTDLYHQMKRDNGYTQEAVQRKRMSLEGVLVPLTASINEGWLRAAGFDVVECVWAWANFRAWLAVKR